MRKLSLISFVFIVIHLTAYSQINILAFDFYSKNKAINIKVFDDSNCEKRKTILIFRGKTLSNDSLINCCLCGGKINEPLDSIYFSGKNISIVQKNDSYKDSLVFYSVDSNFKLAYINRTYWNKPRQIISFTLRKNINFSFDTFNYIKSYAELEKNKYFKHRILLKKK